MHSTSALQDTNAAVTAEKSSTNTRPLLSSGSLKPVSINDHDLPPGDIPIGHRSEVDLPAGDIPFVNRPK
jgi:hypothetical protein